jgi:hypothetical protein
VFPDDEDDLRELNSINYIPLLSVRPAELRALKELPERSKNALFPFMILRPWTSAHYLESVLQKISDAYGDRPLIVDAGVNEPTEGTSRPVHTELANLRQPADGYRNWYEFLVERPNYIPSLQLDAPSQFVAQIARLASLGRGLAIRIPQPAFGSAANFVQIMRAYVQASDICVILDYEQASRELLTRIAATRSIVQNILSVEPACSIALSASSFPMDFTSRTGQEIYERQFFNGVKEAFKGASLIYSDRGSARATRQNGGGGSPAPRVDLAGAGEWAFFREEDDGDRDEAYFTAARRAMGSALWDSDLQLWATQMIRRTAANDVDAIISPARSTAVRINMHLQQQLFYDSPEEKYDTDEEWTD